MDRRNFLTSATALVGASLLPNIAKADPAGVMPWDFEEQKRIIDNFRKRRLRFAKLESNKIHEWSDYRGWEELESNSNILWVVGDEILSEYNPKPERWSHLHLEYPNDLGLIKGSVAIRCKENKRFSHEELFQKMGVGLSRETIYGLIISSGIGNGFPCKIANLTINNLVWDHEGFWEKSNQFKDKTGYGMIVSFFVYGTHKRPPLELIEKSAIV